ncbi:MAG TPA: ABC transporter permease [Phycisphaerales bacterium]|nr:ABC transporter permease [Phycisphaerales bacterium]
MRPMLAVLRRELAGYFATPVAYVFIVVFLVLTGVFTFSEELGNFFSRGQADLAPFFSFHPWLYLFLIPAISMRLWAEERRSGTIELLLTLPIPPWAAVTGKFLAAWAFTGLALALTFPMWITVSVLGRPDHGAIVTAYIGSFLMAGGFLAVGACVSAMTKSQPVAFVLTTVACFLLLLAGFPFVQDALAGWAPPLVRDAVAGLSFLTRFDAISKGVLALPDLLFFLALIGAALAANAIIIDLKKAA